MQFKAVFLASALAALAQAVEFTNPTFATITAGQPFTITWTEASGPVTITLKNGDPGNLQTVSTIGSGLSGGTFTWNVPASLTQDTYALEIRDSTPTPNYSTQFELIGGVRSSASVTVSRTVSNTASNTASDSTVSSTGSASTGSASSTNTAETTSSTGSSTIARSTTSSRTSTSATSSPTSAPAGGMASGLTSNLALVFLAAGALFMIN